MSTALLQKTRGFSALERCDRCGAQAYHEASKGSSNILFCAHHCTEHKKKLTAEGWHITDASNGPK